MSDGAITLYKSPGKHGFLSNLFPCKVEFEEEVFNSSEHAYQKAKFKDPKVWDWVKQAPAPRFVCIIAHGLHFYDMNPEWKNIRLQRMRDVTYAKFSQNETLKQKLIDTHPSVLIENSKTDAYWGIGKRGKGKNMLGVILMEVRDLMMKEE